MITAGQSVTVLAERAAQERLLNAYIRETGRIDPRVAPGCPRLRPAPPELRYGEPTGETVMLLELPATARVLAGTITYYSLVGHHQYGDRIWAGPLDGTEWLPVNGATELADLLVSELAARETDPAARETRRLSLLENIANSIEKATLYVADQLDHDPVPLDSGSSGQFLAAERSLCFGHPFHPTPKSSEGFSAEDLRRYTPELGASFTLEYFAVTPELVVEEFLPGAREQSIPEPVNRAARDRLGPQGDWPLIPCHPWQAAYLMRHPAVVPLIDAGLIVHLGPLGEQVCPTSSVRTVWAPQHGQFVKLPLNVRITNFVRVNPPDQLQRSLDASRVAAALRRALPLPDFTLLLEAGYRTVAPPHLDGPDRDEVAGSFGVLFRQAPGFADGDQPMVLAGLLEPRPHDGLPALARAVHEAARLRSVPVTTAFVAEWLRRYLAISLLPILRCFALGGVSLEAHVQNSMVTLKSFWPAHFYVRDLEGASISRERARATGLFGVHLPDNSPALYSDDQAWHRLKYYFCVNHLGHLIFTLARYVAGNEAALWQVVRSVLDQNAGWIDTRYLEDLRSARDLPAKANLISRFQGRSETPLYVPIPNPLREGGLS